MGTPEIARKSAAVGKIQQPIRTPEIARKSAAVGEIKQPIRIPEEIQRAEIQLRASGYNGSWL